MMAGCFAVVGLITASVISNLDPIAQL